MLRIAPSPALLLLCALAFPQAALAASSGAPLSDQEVVADFVAEIEQVCQTKMREEIDTAQREDAGKGAALEAFMTPALYCGCISGELGRTVSAEAVRADDREALGRQLQNAASTCAVQRAKLMFGKNCRTWFGSIPLDEEDNLTKTEEEEFIGMLCSCVAKNAESITAENLAEVTRQTKVDVARMRELVLGEAKANPLSLFGGNCAADMRALLVRYKPQLAEPDAPLTTEEKSKVDALAAKMMGQCWDNADERRKKGKPADPVEARRWERVTSDKYCYCVGDELQARVTPRLMRFGTKSDGDNLATEVLRSCLYRE